MIISIDLPKLRNAEYIQFCKNFATLIQANNPVALSIQPQYETFLAKISELETLFKQTTSSAITPEIEALDLRRDRAINGLVAIINGYSFHFEASISNAALVLQNNLKLYNSSIARENYQSETAILNNIINDWENKPEFNSALSTLNLIAWKDELKVANQLFNEKYIVRTQEYGTASTETLRAKRYETNECYFELRKFLEAFEIIKNTAEYTKTIKELNALIEQYNSLLSNRQGGANKIESNS